MELSPYTIEERPSKYNWGRWTKWYRKERCRCRRDSKVVRLTAYRKKNNKIISKEIKYQAREFAIQ